MEDKSRIRQWLVAGVTILLALSLLVLAIPRLAANLMTGKAASVLDRLHRQEPVALADLETVIRQHRRAGRLVGDGRLATDRGLAELLIADRLPDGQTEAAARLENAVEALSTGLSRAPANPYAWARLAYAEARLRGWTPTALSSLRLALLTAAHEPRLLWSRLHLAFLAWPYLPDDDHELVYRQIRLGWDEDPAKLSQLAVDLDRINPVRAALLRRPDAAEAFEQRLRAGS